MTGRSGKRGFLQRKNGFIKAERLPGSCRACFYWTVLMGTLGDPSFLRGTHTAGSWRENRGRKKKKKSLMLSQRPVFQNLTSAHRAHRLLWVQNVQLFAGSEDIHQVHGVGAFQEGVVRLQDEVMVLQACTAGGRQVELLHQ